MWSWLPTAIGVTGLWLVRNHGWAWGINLASQAVWIAYAVATEQYGFIVASLAYSAVFGKNLWHWWRERPKAFVGNVFTSGGYASKASPYAYRCVAEGTAVSNKVHVGMRFTAEGIEMVVTEVVFCPEEPKERVRWMAVDWESYVERNTYSEFNEF